MMDESQVLDLLQQVGAFRAGHFVYVSGLHGDTYVNKNAMYPYTREMSKLCQSIAEMYKDKNIEAVVGPATGGIILSQWVAYHLSQMSSREVYGAYADKDDDDGFVIKRGYDDVIRGKNTLIVEDLTTTGGSIKKVVEAARSTGANVIAAVTLVNRGRVTREAIGNPPEFVSLVNLDLDQWPEEECDLCKRGIPVNTDVGHGKDFLARQRK